MDSLLETQRKMHEERERLIDAMVKETMSEKKTHKAKINSEQRMKNLVKRYHDATEALEKMYRDDEGSRRMEVESVSGPNEFAEFYARLKQLKDAHRRNPDELAEPLTLEFQKMHEAAADPDRHEPEMVVFSDEEGYGRFLDLHVLFNQYNNLKGIKHTDYISYLSIFDCFNDIQRQTTKKTGAYAEYLRNIKEYLLSYIDRTRPLYDVQGEIEKANAEVEKKLAAGTLAGWSIEKPAGPQGASIDLTAYSNPNDLEGLGLERLKGALQAMGLKCGGTLKERADRLFATKGHKLSDMEKRALAKKDDDKEQNRIKELAKLEAHVAVLGGILSEERLATRENVERKQARAAGEADDDDDEAIIESDEEYDDSAPYNPKNLPLGWDGKPIPYWLYKLHGLNISYSCQICGNQVYKGPKAFQKHFTEWRHSHGMRCLGIPNTAHFANITDIKDALDLWNKLKTQKEKQRWNPDLDEEFEDSSGNVVTRKTFEDLKRQGLL